MSRRFPDRPIVAVGAVIIAPEGVLLVRRGQPPLMGEWSLPGGAVETGETVAAALLREVREETGLNVHVGPLLGVFDRIHHDDQGRVEYHYVLIDFLCTAVGGTLRAGSDTADALWALPSELSDYGLSESAIAVVQKGIGCAASAA